MRSVHIVLVLVLVLVPEDRPGRRLTGPMPCPEHPSPLALGLVLVSWVLGLLGLLGLLVVHDAWLRPLRGGFAVAAADAGCGAVLILLLCFALLYFAILWRGMRCSSPPPLAPFGAL